MRTNMLLSHSADCLYWLGRYLERAEHTARLLNVHLDLMLDQPPERVDQRRQYVLATLDLPTDYEKAQDDYQLTESIIFDADNMNSVKFCIRAARDNARQVREQISTEMWNQLNQFYLYVEQIRVNG